MAKTASQNKDADAVEKTIAAMPDADRVVAERLHMVILSAAPQLSPKLWYGQPAYARDGKVVCFFRGADVDDERYLTFGFSGEANLDEGNIWPTSFAIAQLADGDERRIERLVKQATS